VYLVQFFTGYPFLFSDRGFGKTAKSCERLKVAAVKENPLMPMQQFLRSTLLKLIASLTRFCEVISFLLLSQRAEPRN
jgi:hypothetical protein